MKKLLSAVLFLIILSASAIAQSYIGVGLSVNRSSNYDPTPDRLKDGGKVFPGVYVEGAYKLPYGLQAKLLAEYSNTPLLQTIFTTDEGSRKAVGEFRLRPELRLWFNKENSIRPFVSGGIDYYHQRFKEQSGKVEEYGEYYEHTTPSLPSSGLNPFLTFGAGINKDHEVSFTRLFEDQTNLNPSRLSGYRINYFYMKPIYKSFDLKIGIEADYLRFRETNGLGYIDLYYEKDTVIKARVGFIFK